LTRVYLYQLTAFPKRQENLTGGLNQNGYKFKYIGWGYRVIRGAEDRRKIFLAEILGPSSPTLPLSYHPAQAGFLDPYGDEAEGCSPLDVRADALGKKEQNTASAFQGTAQHTNGQHTQNKIEKTPLGGAPSSKIDPPQVRGYNMSHNTNQIDNRFAEPTDRPVILTDAGQPIDQADPLPFAIIEEAPPASKKENPLLLRYRLVREALAKGREWEIILEALHSKVVGEENVLKALTLSSLSILLPDGWDFSTYTNASSQMGKSYATYTVNSMLFNHRTIWQQSFSPKSFYYNAKEDPYWMKGKILVLDELADLSEESLAILKPLISWTQGGVSHMTVNKKQEIETMTIKAKPVIAANSAKLAEDYGFQLSNRFLKLGLDESKEQTDAINKSKCKSAQLGPYRRMDSVPIAQQLILEIEKFRPSGIVIPLSHVVKVNGEARNILDLFFAMVASCAYLHHHRRGKLKHADGDVLIASASDIQEAADLWNSFAAQRQRGASGRYAKALEALRMWYRNNPTICELDNPLHPTVDDVKDQYNAIYHDSPISSKTMANMLTDLQELDLVSGRRPEGERFYIYELPPGDDDMLQISCDFGNAPAIYDEWLGKMAEVGVYVPDEIRDLVLDQGENPPMSEPTLAEVVDMLRDIGDYGVDKGGITSLRDDPDRGELLFDELIRRGIIAYNPKTKRYVYQGQGRR
jgi:hypothetical protein